MVRRKFLNVVGAAIVAIFLATGILPVAQGQSLGSSAVQKADFLRGVTSSEGIPDAQAFAGGAKVVVFGDSHASGTNAPFRVDERGCLKGHLSWPAQLQATQGLAQGDLIDLSCNGASINSTGFHFSDEVRHAEALGAIGPKTENIFIQFGKNDQWGHSSINLRYSVINCLFDLVNGCGERAVAAGTMQDPAAVTGENYAERMKPVIDYLKYYAPNAHITLLGYQEYMPRTGSEICVRIGGTEMRKPDAVNLVSYMNQLEAAIRDASEILEVQHVDLREATAGHSSCSADPWVNGVLDMRVNAVGGTWHPSPKGDAVTAGMLSAQL
ncbi:SGNH/GDSL hydrolase family protein [Corynebacterium crudilactis]|uniref:Hydrolase n=1 Tax=Corynebacterium crudilactis TaxID=1652495 RepID=A0A172QRD5_9CORY|nr:SGNH/GDSL hydrolase family protein [Corynebacterium crudilactis]ANE03220.1 hydrolase [Corynebacterium crudilactis]